MLEDGPSTCERCGGELRRVLHPAGIIFKGKGFYKTDSRSSSSGSVSSAPSTGKPASAESSTPETPKPAGSDSGTGSTGSTGSGAKTSKPATAAD